MKLVLICPDSLPCPPIRSGAIELLMARKAPYLAKLGFDVTVLSIQDPMLANKETIHGVRYIRFPKKNYLENVISYVQAESFPVIQVYNKPDWVLPIKQVCFHSRVVLSLHNQVFGSHLEQSELEEIVQAVDHMVAVSQFLADSIARRCPSAKAKITVLYTGDEPSIYTPHYTLQGQRIALEMKKKLGIPADYFVALFVGRLVPKKGCHLLITAMKKVLQQQPRTALVIVGSKWFGNFSENGYVKMLREQAKPISEHIYFTSFLPVYELPDYYTMSDVLICASQWKEPLARVQYEAMTAGIPIITTGRGGNTEIIKHGQNGIVISQYEHPDAFAESMLYMIKNRGKREMMGITNRGLIENCFNFEQYALRIAEVYKRFDLSEGDTHSKVPAS
ncbi:glycosyltransferase family 4 protein [Paenibacillus aestuarii]|uniref:Glycosyltransferase family 4 protein n=2 Tax=Paenibacillus aestuarii TaxID=516965 RepID=A0ABW0K3E7_9BACL|nr:glycosyltransferase family 4 protein [Paenibacillus aestuarii]